MKSLILAVTTHTMLEMTSIIEKGLGRKAKIKNMPVQKADATATWADITKAKKFLNWEPRISLEEGIAKTINGTMKTGNILITGVAGFIGSRVARKLLEQGEHIIGIDNINDYYDTRLPSSLPAFNYRVRIHYYDK